MSLRLLIIILFISLSQTGCDRNNKLPDIATVDPTYYETFPKNINDWKENRVKNLLSDTGWLNVSGLFWLKKGDNSFGSAPENSINYKNAPEKIGVISWTDELTFSPQPGLDIRDNNNQILTSKIKLFTDSDENTTQIKVDSLTWFVIKRGDRLAIRLRDLEAPAIKAFTKINYFEQTKDWVKAAKFIPYDAPQEVSIMTIIDEPWMAIAAGDLEFEISGEVFRLKALESSNNRLFIIFGDQTNGKSSYGSGRFVYVEKPKENSEFTVLDFNKAYNPPCVFTQFSTCPLPPEENKLAVAVNAGEKMYSGFTY